MIRIAAAFFIGIFSTSAFADARSQAALRDYLNAIDANPAWSASAGSIHGEGNTTIVEDVEISRTDPAIAVIFDEIRFDNLAIGSDGTITASAIHARSVAISTERFSLAIPELNAAKVDIPVSRYLQFSPDRPITWIAKIYTALAQGQAERIAIPTMTLVQNFAVPGDSQSIGSETIYREFVAEDFHSGIIAKISVGEMAISQTTPDGPMQMKIGPTVANGINIGQMARVLDPDAYEGGLGDGIWKPITDRVVYSDFEIRPPDGSIIGIARIVANDMAMRQPERPFTENLDWLITHPDAAEDDIRQRMVGFFPNLMRSMRIGELRIEGMAFRPPEPGKVIIDQIRIAGFSADGIEEVSVDGVRLAAPKVTFALDRFAITGIGFSDFDNIVAIVDLSERRDDPAIKSEIMQRAFDTLPIFDGILLSGFSLAADGKVLLEIGEYDFTVTGHLQRLPIAGTFRLRDLILSADLWRDTATPFAEALDAIGYAEISIDSDGEASWTADTGLLDATIEYRVRDIADIRFEYAISGLTQSWLDTVFKLMPSLEGNADPMAGLAMISTLGFKNALVEITDRSIVDRALAYAAGKQGLDTQAYRAQLKGALPFMLSLLGDPDLQNKTATALQAFLDGGHRLTISLEPEDIVLLPMFLGTAAMSPKALVELLGGQISTRPVN